MRTNPVKAALKNGQLQLGCAFGMIPSPEIARILAAAGFRWTFIDGEHGTFGTDTLHILATACQRAGIVPVIRVADLQYALVARALDVGGMGIMFPRVEAPELLERAISWTKFPPEGVRGFGLGGAHIEYEKATIPQMIDHLNAHTLVTLQIETVRAFEAREELLSVPGIDAVMVGPADLSISLGVPGEFQHPKMVATVEAIRDTCLRKGIAPGIHNRTVPLAQFWKERGMKFLSCGAEFSMLMDGATGIVKAVAG